MELQQLESVRQTYAKKLGVMITIAIITIIACVIMAYIAIMNFGNGAIRALISVMGIGIIIASIALVVNYFVSRKDADAYRKLYKAYFVERSLNQVFTDTQYNHTAGMPVEVLRETGMINTGDIYESNDLFSGKYHDIALSQADVHISVEQTDSEGNSSYVTIFKGRWMVFEFPKQFNFRLQVVDKHFTARKKPGKNPATNRKFEKYSTESITFDKKFKTYAEDGFEVYYILDPSLINRIEQLSESHKGRLLLCFIDNKLSVAIDDRKDAFEPPRPFKPIDEAKELAKVNQDIKTITDFVDYLKLDKKLFKKEQGVK